MKFYLKELVSNKLYAKATGAPIQFEPVGDDQGVLATDNEVIIKELDQAVARHVGGVVSITEEQFTDAKKKAIASPSLFNFPRERPSINGMMFLQNQDASAAGANLATNPVRLHGQLRDIPKEIPEPIKVQTDFVRPATRKGFFKEKPNEAK